MSDANFSESNTAEATVREAYFATLLQQMRIAFNRFSLPLLVATITALALAVWPWVHHSEFDTLFNIVIVGAPLFLLMLSRVIIGEYRGVDVVRGRVVDILLLFGGIAIFWMLPAEINEQTVINALVWFIALHGLVAMAPVLGGVSYDGAWLFNWKLFTRILTAFLFSHVLYLGIMTLLWTADGLFGIGQTQKIATTLYALILGSFNSWFLCGGIPRRTDITVTNVDFPSSLKVFNYYILLPVTLIAVIVNSMYTLHWYNGLNLSDGAPFLHKLLAGEFNSQSLIAVNVLCSLVALLFVLLAYPAERNQIFSWSKGLSRTILLMLLLTGLMSLPWLFGEIGESDKVVLDYFGAFIGLLSCVLLIIASIPALHRYKVSFIPGTILVFGIVAAIGPLSSHSVSSSILFQQFKQELRENDRLSEEGYILPADSAANLRFYHTFNNRYQDFGYDWFQEFTARDLDEALGGFKGFDIQTQNQVYYFSRKDSLRSLLNLASRLPISAPREATKRIGRSFSVRAASDHIGKFPPIRTGDSDVAFPMEISVYTDKRIDTLVIDGRRSTIEISYDNILGQLQFKRNSGKVLTVHLLNDSLLSAIKAGHSTASVQSSETYFVEANSEDLDVKVHVVQLRGRYSKNVNSSDLQEQFNIQSGALVVYMDW